MSLETKNINNSKPWIKSKTIWFNVIMLTLMIVNELEVLLIIPHAWAMLISGLGNVVIRFITDKAIE